MYLRQTITNKEVMTAPRLQGGLGFTPDEVQHADRVEIWAYSITAVPDENDYREGRLINQEGRLLRTRRLPL